MPKGKGKPVDLDTRSFPSQKAAEDYFREMLYRYEVGQRISPQDSLDLLALLKRHEHYEQKLGVGIAHFEVMEAQYKSHCFMVVRTDGTREDFSFVHCVSGRKSAPAAPPRKFPIDLAALRAARISKAN